ncbi:MAG: hypothetical protein A3F13_00900 [Gammaproteobacteria bacterium RIFCSPHIGHO2_12_FULL_40_19]|nr:MAG: hypothetical protein A3F13_00900 [Gammaproteobacteria bacterium RIFCSPHIGHO2_12_FULL_40_19]
MSRVLKNKQNGMAALAITMTILAVVTIIAMFSARIIVTDNKIYQNQQNNAYAFNAAQAGVDYAVGYLNQNLFKVQSTGLSYCGSVGNTTCLTDGGTVQSCGTSAPTSTLSNNATYTMQYSCTVANSVQTLSIQSTGRSADGSATRTITVLVRQYVLGSDLNGIVAGSGVGVALAVGNIAGTPANVLIKSSATATNACTVAGGGCPTAPTTAIVSAGNVIAAGDSIKNTATVVGSVTLDKNTLPASYSPTFQFNQSSLANLTTTQIQTNYLGYLFCGTQGAGSCACAAGSLCLATNADVTDIPHNSDGRYNNGSPTGDQTYDSSTTTTYPTAGITVSGSNGQIVFIDVGINNTATFNGAFKLGTTSVGSCSAGTAPATLIVNGNVILAGSSSNATTICGGVYATGSVQLNNAANVFGFVVGVQGVAVNTAAGAGITGSLVAGPNALANTNFPNGFGMTSGGFVILNNKTLSGGLDSQRYNEYGIVSGSWRDF